MAVTDWRIPKAGLDWMTCEERAWEVIDAIWSDSREIDSAKLLAELTDGQRAVYALTWVEREVSNGGFDQCFLNPAGGMVADAIQGARLLGLDPYADLIARAAEAALGTADRLSQPERQRRVDALSQETVATLDSYADQFYELLESHPLDAAVCAYIDKRPNEFFLEHEPTSEELAQALLDLARALLAGPPPRDHDRIAAILRDAADQAHQAASDSLAAQIQSLAVQLLRDARLNAMSSGLCNRQNPYANRGQ